MESLGEFAAGISHHLNNILQPLVLSSDVAKNPNDENIDPVKNQSTLQKHKKRKSPQQNNNIMEKTKRTRTVNKKVRNKASSILLF